MYTRPFDYHLLYFKNISKRHSPTVISKDTPICKSVWMNMRELDVTQNEKKSGCTSRKVILVVVVINDKE